MEKVNKEQTPWGFRATLVSKNEYSGVVLIVKEGERTPYIYHKKRDKTWVVSQGLIQYTAEGKVRLVGEGEAIHILPGIMHRMAAIKGDATIIEIGTKLLDDVVVVEDK